MKQKERFTPDQRKAMILKAAVEVVQAKGWDGLTRDAVSLQAKIAVGTINYSFKTMDNLRDAVVQYAIDHHEDDAMLPFIVKALAAGNDVACNAPKAVKSAALKLLM